jgi:Zn-dependent peptidase ImmA (M78 family)/transcriptional regulator with XRE-family HTH domain
MEPDSRRLGETMEATAYGDRVRAARILRGWKSVDLADEMGWLPSRQTTIEQSETVQLEIGVLRRMAGKLEFPEQFFATAPSAALSSEELLFRAPVATTKREKVYLAEFARVVGEILAWLDTYHRLPPVRLPSLRSDTPVDEAAAKTRECLGVSPAQPIGNLTHRLERAGLPIVVRDIAAWEKFALPGGAEVVMTERHLGYSARVGEHGDRPVTILRAHESWERTRWTIAHEAGHVVLHGSGLPRNAESQASAFASELLAPAHALRQEMPRHVTLAALTGMKLRWGISIGALIPHLFIHHLINEERKATLQRQLYIRKNPETGRSWGRDEPGRDARSVEQPSLIATWMQRCLGGAVPNLVATLSGIWPPDLLAQVISGQRTQSSRTQSSQSNTAGRARDSEVVSLQEWRRRA